MTRFIRRLLEQGVREFLHDECPQLAAALSFYVLFTVFPLLIFAASAVGLFLQSESLRQDIVDEVLKNIPLNEGEGRDAVTNAVRDVAGPGSGALGLLAIVGMAWSASGMFGALRRGLNVAFDDIEARRPFFQQKLFDLGLVVALALFFIASIGATAFLRIVRTNADQLGSLGDVASGAGLLWDAASYGIPLVLSFVAFIALYTIVPSRIRRPGDVWPGALLAAALFETVKLLFSFYLENFTSYDLVYGSLGAVAAFLFWIYISANIALLGAEIAAEYPRIPATGYMQPVLEGLGLPPHETIWELVRALFVRRPAR